MARRRFTATGIMLLATLLACALSACGGPVSSSPGSSPTAPSTTVTSTTVTGDGGSTGTGSKAGTSTGGRQNGSAINTTEPPKTETVPMVDGDSVSIAELYLTQAGLRVGKELQESNLVVPPTLVIATSPYVGDLVPYGATVDLLVSTGSLVCQPTSGVRCDFFTVPIPMPSLTGQTFEQAKATLALEGITAGPGVLQASAEAAGTVVCTVPGAGDSVYSSTIVMIGISSGDAESPPATLCGTSPTQPPTSPGQPPTSPGQPPTSPGQPSTSP